MSILRSMGATYCEIRPQGADEVRKTVRINLGTSRTEVQRLLDAGANGKSYNLNDYRRMIIHKDDIIEPLEWHYSDFKSKLEDYLLKKKIEKVKAMVGAPTRAFK